MEKGTYIAFISPLQEKKSAKDIRIVYVSFTTE